LAPIPIHTDINRASLTHDTAEGKRSAIAAATTERITILIMFQATTPETYQISFYWRITCCLILSEVFSYKAGRLSFTGF
jgi:hypothetical protein